MNDEKTFTQAEVDRIVGERLERDRRQRGVSSAQRFTQEDVDRIVSERLERDRRRQAFTAANPEMQQAETRLVTLSAAGSAQVDAAGAGHAEVDAAGAGHAEAPADGSVEAFVAAAVAAAASGSGPAEVPADGSVEAAVNYEQRAHDLEQQLLRAQAREILTDRGMPSQLAAFLDYSSPEACLETIGALEQVFKQGVQTAVNARLGASSVKLPRGEIKTPARMTDAEFYSSLFNGRI